MRNIVAVLLSVFIAFSQSANRDSDGKIHENLSLGIRTGSTPQQVKSVGYPNPAPHDLEQNWRYVAVGEDRSKATALKIVCPEIRLPKNGNRCGDTVVIVEDGDEEKQVCDGPFIMVTKNNDITIKFSTGNRDGGTVRCTVQAIYIDSSGNELIITTPKPTPRPARNQFRFIPSEELDSSEHGGEEGEKSTSCPCGWANKMSSRIVNGAEAGRNEFPFAAALIDRRTGGNFCGATIITEYHAITAAHCTDENLAENAPMAIKVGIHNIYDAIKPPAQVIDVERTVQHERYTGKPSMKHDLSLLILKDRIIFGPHVGPACLPRNYLTLDRQYIKIIGWGDTSFRGSSSDTLQKANVRVVPIDECNSDFTDVDTVDPSQICTFSKSRDTCQGDSGGPVIWVDPDTNRYTLIGAVSFGSGCGGLSVHTAIGHYIDWINYHVQASKRTRICQKIN